MGALGRCREKAPAVCRSKFKRALGARVREGAARMSDVRIKLKSAAMVPPAAGDPIAGVIWITISMALFAGLAVFSRQAMNAGMHPFEVVFPRNACACVLLAPLLVYRGRSLLRSQRAGLYGVRVAISLLSMQLVLRALPHPDRRGHGHQLSGPAVWYPGCRL